MNTTIAIKIRAQLEELSKVESIIEDLYEKGAIDEACYGNVLVVATEATLNAIHHGSKDDPSKVIEFSLSIEGKEMEVVVSDTGNGFDHENLPDPTDPENIEKGSGRGIFIMKNLSDELEFLNDGATIKATFELQTPVSVEA